MKANVTPTRTVDLANLFQRFQDRVRSTDVAQLSDLPRTVVPELRERWAHLPPQVRRRIVGEMVELAEMNLDLNFCRVFLVALDDDDPEVRIKAIQGLWEEEAIFVLQALLRRVDIESEPDVRAALAQALGRFTELDVLARLPQEEAARLRSTLLALLDAREPITVRRRALESLGVYSDSLVQQAIEDAYSGDDHSLRVSALYAMGRSLNPRWLPILLNELHNEDPEIRYEAATACGELGAQEATDDLIELTEDPDHEVRAAAIQALGRIGGSIATTFLCQLTKSENPFIREAAQEALAEALFQSDPLHPASW